MEPKERFKKLLEKHKNDPEYILEGIILCVSEKIAGIMEDRHMTRGQLAEKLGCSAAYVTKLLRGSQNLTLRKLFEVSNALEADLSIDMVPSVRDAIKLHRGHSDSTAVYTRREASTRIVAEKKLRFARKGADKK
ncbi:MAG: helix-turn-helix domain-containing protein [Candidatus Kryptoniota bacterium]